MSKKNGRPYKKPEPARRPGGSDVAARYMAVSDAERAIIDDLVREGLRESLEAKGASKEQILAGADYGLALLKRGMEMDDIVREVVISIWGASPEVADFTVHYLHERAAGSG